MTNYRAVKVNGEKKDYHRHIMEQHLGRPLDRNEVVHHINGNPRDNRIENLQVMSLSEHTHLHQAGRKDPDWVVEQRSEKLKGHVYESQRKLTEEQVLYVRNNYKPYDKKFGARALSQELNVSHSEISRIARGLTYKNFK